MPLILMTIGMTAMFRVVTVEYERARWYRREYLLDATSGYDARYKVKKLDWSNIFILSCKEHAIKGRTLGPMRNPPDWVLTAHANPAMHRDVRELTKQMI